ncbi:hypothetical protein QY97_03766 [Bacillus thermotolerans]|nr:hypothetical protein QY97_03766 [Bacillus thermotolerans]
MDYQRIQDEFQKQWLLLYERCGFRMIQLIVDTLAFLMTLFRILS